MRNLKQGEGVKLLLGPNDVPYLDGNPTSTAPISILNSNDEPRAILPTERLVIDSVYLECQGPDSIYLVAIPPSTAVVISTFPITSTIIAVYNGDDDSGSTRQPAFNVEYPAEGFSLPVGITPSVYQPQGATSLLIGEGRIVEGKTQGIRPSYREATTYR